MSFRLKNTKLHENRCHRKKTPIFCILSTNSVEKDFVSNTDDEDASANQNTENDAQTAASQSEGNYLQSAANQSQVQVTTDQSLFFFSKLHHCLSHQTSLCDFIVDFLPRHR